MSAIQAAGSKTHLHVLLLGAAGTIYSEWRASLTTLGVALPAISTLTNKLQRHAITSAHSLNGVRLSLERSPAPSAQMGGFFLSPSSNQGGAVPPCLPLISPTAYSLQPATCRQPPTAPGSVLPMSLVGLGFPSASFPDKSAAHSARPRLPSVLQDAGWHPSLHALLTDTASIIYSAWHAPQPARGLFPLAPPPAASFPPRHTL